MARYMRSDLGRGHTHLRPPVVVATAGEEEVSSTFSGPRIKLAPINDRIRRTPNSILRSPVPSVEEEVSSTFSGPRIKLVPISDRIRRNSNSILRSPVLPVEEEEVAAGLRVHYTHEPRRNLQRRRASYELRAPAIVRVVNPQFVVSLAPQRRGAPQSILRSPVVVHHAVELSGPEQHLVRIRPPRTTSALTAPILEAPSDAVEIYGPETQLARIRPPRTLPDLAGPFVVEIALGPHGGVMVVRAPSRRPITKSLLQPPAVLQVVEEVIYPTQVTLASSRRPVTQYFLRGLPIGASDIYFAPKITLAASRRGRPKSTVFPPRVVFLAVEIFGPEVQLTRIKHPPVFSQLQSPAVVRTEKALYGPDIHLTLGRRLVAKFVLRPAAVVAADAVEIYGPKITLVRITPPRVYPDLGSPRIINAPPNALGYLATTLVAIRPRPTTTLLRPPAVLEQVVVVYPGPETHLALGRRPVAKSRLEPPVVVFLAVEIFGPEITLVRIRPRRTRRILRPPVVVARVLFFGPATELAPSFRGKPKPFLRRPVVVQQPSAYRQVVPPWLTYSRRGRPTYFLTPPTRVFPFFARKTDITLAPQRRGRPEYFLRPPVIPPLARSIVISLAPQRRGKPTFFLQPPVVVRLAVEIFGPEITLRPSRRPVAKSFIREPLVGRAPFAPISVTLTYSRRGKPTSFRQPERVGQPPFRPIQISLARITPPPVLYRLNPAAVIGAGIAFFGPQIWLVRIKHPKVIQFTINAFDVLQPFIPPRGDVCGFDISGSFICYVEETSSKVIGGDQSTTNIESTTAADSKITGGDMASGKVIGGDQEAN